VKSACKQQHIHSVDASVSDAEQRMPWSGEKL
jgi:hypothetical protein